MFQRFLDIHLYLSATSKRSSSSSLEFVYSCYIYVHFVSVQGANILLTDDGEVKLGRYLVIWVNLLIPSKQNKQHFTFIFFYCTIGLYGVVKVTVWYGTSSCCWRASPTMLWFVMICFVWFLYDTALGVLCNLQLILECRLR